MSTAKPKPANGRGIRPERQRQLRRLQVLKARVALPPDDYLRLLREVGGVTGTMPCAGSLSNDGLRRMIDHLAALAAHTHR